MSEYSIEQKLSGIRAALSKLTANYPGAAYRTPVDFTFDKRKSREELAGVLENRVQQRNFTINPASEETKVDSSL